MQVKPVGQLVFEVNRVPHQISASKLSQGDQKKQSGLKNKDGSEEWSVTASAAWITATKEQGQFKVVVPAQEEEGEARTGSVTVKLGGVTKNLEVKQAAYSA